MSAQPFGMVPLPEERSQRKPRSKGLTMMIDWGLPPGAQRDLLEFAGVYVDLAKIAVGTSRFYDEDRLRAKLDLYREHGIRPFLGGQFQEYVYATRGRSALRPFLEEAARVGFEVVEVSDNVVPLNPDERREQIGLAREVGLAVFGEVGSKSEKSEAAGLIEEAKNAFGAGAELVLVEGAELVEAGKPKLDLLRALETGLDMSRVLIELPGPWVTGTAVSEVHDLKKLLVRELGPDVNIANVMPDLVLETEALRNGLGVVGPSVSRAAAE